MVYWEALKLVKEYQQGQPALTRFANELCLSALNCAPTIFFSYYETEPVVHALFREGLVIKVQLKMVCDLEYGWSSCTVLLRDGDRWISFHDYLETWLYAEYTGKIGYRIQHRWWESLRKSFR